MLIAVVVMVALVLIALSVAAPVIAKSLRRAKEVESEQRAEQYVRAIRLYYRKTHTYPPSIDALKQSNNIRYLRQEYVDPLTGKADWRILHQGEQKTTVKGFFGQELGGLGTSTGGGSLGSASGMGSGIGSSAANGSSTSQIGSTSALASGFSGASMTAGGATGSSGGTGGLGSLSGSASGSVGPIVGVGTAATGTSVIDPNQQTTYQTWEFWYDPRIEQLYQKGHQNAGMGTGAVGSQSASSFGTNVNGQSNSTTGTSSGAGSTFGGGSLLGGGTSPGVPNPPQ